MNSRRLANHLDAIIRGTLGKRRDSEGTCSACGYSCKGLRAPSCPECGVSIAFPGLSTRDPDRIACLTFLGLAAIGLGRTVVRAIIIFAWFSDPDRPQDALDGVALFFIALQLFIQLLFFATLAAVIRSERERGRFGVVGKTFLLVLAAAGIFLVWQPLQFP